MARPVPYDKTPRTAEGRLSGVTTIAEPDRPMRRPFRGMLGLAVLVLAAGSTGAGPNSPIDRAVDAIEPARVLAHIKALASDGFEGRGPGTEGERKTVAYLTDQFRSMGLTPGNPDGTFVQDVPLVGFRAKRVLGSFATRGGPIGLSFPEEVGDQLFKLVGRPSGGLAMMGFRVLMYGAALVGAIVYLTRIKEVRGLTASAHQIEEELSEGELDEGTREIA